MTNKYSELSLSQFARLVGLSKRTDLSDIDRQAQKLSILSGLSVEELMRIPIGEFKHYSIEAQFLERTLPQIHRFVPRYYKVGGFKLQPVVRFDKITTIQALDIANYSKDGIGKIIDFLSCLLVPKGMKYKEGYDIVEVRNAIGTLSVEDALTLIVYYWDILKKALKSFLSYSKLTLNDIKDEDKRNEILNSVQILGDNIKAMGDGSEFYTLFYVPDVQRRESRLDEVVETFKGNFNVLVTIPNRDMVKS